MHSRGISRPPSCRAGPHAGPCHTSKIHVSHYQGLQDRHDAGGGPSAAYIHLPFCKRRCFYCDFPIETVGKRTTSERNRQRMEEYITGVCKEIRHTRRLNTSPLMTVFFGGGTPSLVPPDLLARVLWALNQQFGIAPGAEVSLEADPDTFDRVKLRDYLALGVSRISLGVQSFQEEHLRRSGRAHDLAAVYRAIHIVKEAGVPSWSLDLISGLPHLTLEQWMNSLDEVIQAGPHHVSVYDLQVEEGTPFHRWYSRDPSSLPVDDEAADMYAAGVEKLTGAGYEHYEVSNYAQPGHQCQHNLVYWRCQPYYGFGLGAASYLEGVRFTHPKNMKDYYQWLDQYLAGVDRRQHGRKAGQHAQWRPEEGHRLPEQMDNGNPTKGVAAVSGGLRETITITEPLGDLRGTDVSQAAGMNEKQAAIQEDNSLSPSSSVSSWPSASAPSSSLMSGAAGELSDPLTSQETAQSMDLQGRGPTGGGGARWPGDHLPQESLEEHMLDLLMLRLRLAEGLDLTEVEEKFGRQMASRVEAVLVDCEGRGLVCRCGGPGSRTMRLVDPSGFLLSNDIISDIFLSVSGEADDLSGSRRLSSGNGAKS